MKTCLELSIDFPHISNLLLFQLHAKGGLQQPRHVLLLRHRLLPVLSGDVLLQLELVLGHCVDALLYRVLGDEPGNGSRQLRWTLSLFCLTAGRVKTEQNW